jgi:hypothetical protein
MFYEFPKDLRVTLANSRNVNLIQSPYQIEYCLLNNIVLNQSEELINLNQILFWLMTTSLSRIVFKWKYGTKTERSINC